MTRLVQKILYARTQFPDSSLAELCDPLTMPLTLAKARSKLDHTIGKLYQKQLLTSDTQRVAHLFMLHQGRT